MMRCLMGTLPLPSPVLTLVISLPLSLSTSLVLSLHLVMESHQRGSSPAVSAEISEITS